MGKVKTVIYRDYTIQIMDRKLVPPKPGSAEPRHTLTALFTTRANVSTRGGVAEFASVDINGRKPSHTFDIRWTPIPFDVRNFVRDARGQLFSILAIENKDLADRTILIHCANSGDENTEAAR